MAERVRIELNREGLVEGVLAQPFNPVDPYIDIKDEKTQKNITYSLQDISCLLMKPAPGWSLTKEVIEAKERILTLSGSVYEALLLKGKNYPSGFTAYLPDQDIYKIAFFPQGCIKSRCLEQPVGEILKEKGLISDLALEEALNDQKKLRSQRLGEVIAKTDDIPQRMIDQAIEKASQEGRIPPRVRVGDILVAAGLISREQVNEALASQETGKKKRIGTLLIERGFITEEQLLTALAVKFHVPFVNMKNVEPAPEALNAIPQNLIYDMQILPIEADGDVITIVTSQPTDPTIEDSLRFYTNKRIKIAVSTSDQIAAAIIKYFPLDDSRIKDLIGEMIEEPSEVSEESEGERFSESDSQIIQLVNRLLVEGYLKTASDVHLEPGVRNQPLNVRYRIDGICRIAHKIPAAYKNAVTSRVKIMSGLDIAEHRRPQSGKMNIKYKNERLEYRVEVTPTIGNNEDVVLRILPSFKALRLEDLGFTQWNHDHFKQIISKPYGLVLSVGPTGSGKTTTLHAGLALLNDDERKIWTAEDPVEITQLGLRQVQVNPKIGFSFQDALRSFLRADPDIIMIGEMRDADTAKTAIEAALTGHLVLSTLHTNSAPETLVRLVEMGMDPYSFADAVLGVLAQRLTRRLCENCKVSYHPGKEEYDELEVQYHSESAGQTEGLPPYTDELLLMKKQGCELCAGTGYRGRLAIHELMIATDGVKQSVRARSSAMDIRNIALAEGMKTLKMDGILKVFRGFTDMEQVLKVCL
ncbi:MAG: Flp pilus assembly complex ATPase component TadA [Deltaproteobacteria bacterium]|nr:Flp pilus assembly complex ATPase component TadA [Deltaproteobacteria bacterium]